jgi:hypothetical protein
VNNQMRTTPAIILALAFALSAAAQTQAPDSKGAAEIYQTLYLTNLTQANDANEIVTDLRNMLPNAKLYYVASQGAISLRGSAEEMALAQKILTDLDKTKKIYRLTYTMTEKDGGKIIGVQHFSMIIAGYLSPREAQRRRTRHRKSPISTLVRRLMLHSMVILTEYVCAARSCNRVSRKISPSSARRIP